MIENDKNKLNDNELDEIAGGVNTRKKKPNIALTYGLPILKYGAPIKRPEKPVPPSVEPKPIEPKPDDKDDKKEKDNNQ